MSGDLAQDLVSWGLGISLALAIIAWLGFRQLAATASGRGALAVAAALLPVSISLAGLKTGVEESSRTRFCLDCHEMQDHGKSLFADNTKALAAVHYQNRLVDRDTVCYSCHTDYAMFGDVKAKLNGLRHVWVHYFGTIPDRFTLYLPYPNYNCLHCHADARRYLESPPHRPFLSEITAGKKSCLECHTVAHDMEKVKAGEFWQAQ